MGFPVMRKSKMSCITFKNPVKIGVELPPESLLILFSDHEFVENPHLTGSKRSVMAQQVAHAEAHDIVFSLPSSPGSVAEIHDFARIPWLSHKIVTFLNSDWSDGYSNQNL